MMEGPHMAGFSPVISRNILSTALASLRRVLSSTASMKAATDALVFLVFGSDMGELHYAPILIPTLMAVNLNPPLLPPRPVSTRPAAAAVAWPPAYRNRGGS